MSSKFNGIRKFRNRIFHHEPISWNLQALINYKQEIFEGINWLNKGLLEWSSDIFIINNIIDKQKELIR